MTLARAKPENFTLIYPKFTTSINFEIPGRNLAMSGDFAITYNMKDVDTRDYYGKNTYATYIYADNALTRMENMNIPGGKRLLIIHESMSNCIIPFVALGVSHIYAIDLRHFSGSLKRFIEQEKLDAVIVMYYATVPGRYANPSATKENKKFYDFR